MRNAKKLTEVTLPLDAVNRASAREKWISHETAVMHNELRTRLLCETEVRDGRK
jgi:hypothetical protein